ncbi:HD domain-containing phosphohydrolase [Thermodesulfobacteriota bacterium]
MIKKIIVAIIAKSSGFIGVLYQSRLYLVKPNVPNQINLSWLQPMPTSSRGASSYNALSWFSCCDTNVNNSESIFSGYQSKNFRSEMEKEKIDLITQVTLDINEVNDISMLLEAILTKIRKFFNADGGSIYLQEEGKLVFKYTQNDTLAERLGPEKKLIYNTFEIPINNDSIAGYVAGNKQVANIPDVQSLAGSEPYHFDGAFDDIADYRSISLLTVPMINQRGRVLGVMQMINAQNDEGNIIPFSHSDETLIKHFAASAALAVERAQMTRNILLRTIRMAELRDPMETGAHVNRVAAYSVEIYEAWARNNGVPTEEIERQKDLLRMAAMLHDVGKVAISDLILKKPGKLSSAEFEIIKSHPFTGAKVFEDSQSPFEDLASEVALNHHEKWNGTGYPGHVDLTTGKPLQGYEGPDGLPRPKKGEEIPISGRIVAVADVYDALCCRRSYKEPWDKERVLEEMRNSSGRDFDPGVMDAFFSCLDVIESIGRMYPDEE